MNNLYESHNATDAKSKEQNLKSKILIEAKEWAFKEKSVILGWVVYPGLMMTFICTSQYGTLLIKDSFMDDK